MRGLAALFFSISFYALQLVAYPAAPDVQATPGALCDTKNAHYEGTRYFEKIPYCQRRVTAKMRRLVYDAYGIHPAYRHNYTIDHFIPLSAGGDNSIANLWPEHRGIKKLRYNLEVQVYWQLRRGEITQAEAIEIVADAKLNPPMDIQLLAYREGMNMFHNGHLADLPIFPARSFVK